MIRLITARLLLMALFLIAMASSTVAAVPPTISYQGRLLNNAGDPVADGSHQVKFKFYGSPTDVDSLWSSGFQSVMVTDGLFDYNLGSSVALPGNLFFSPTRYLGITVGADSELSPRTPLTAAPYANYAKVADLAHTAENAYNADNAEAFAGETPDFYLNWGDMTNVPAGFADNIDDVDTDWNNLNNVPAGFADGVDNVGAGDITSVNPGSGLSGGGVSGEVLLSVATDGITAVHIASGAVGRFEVNDNAIGNAEMRNDAIGSAEVIDGSLHTGDIMDLTLFNVDIAIVADIEVTKIEGTAVNLNSAQTITGTKTFDDLQVSTTTRRIAINSHAFVPALSSQTYTRNVNNLTIGVTGTSQTFYANVSLPDGATVTELEGHFYDNDASGDWTLELIRSPHGSPMNVMASVSTTGLPGTTNIIDNTIWNAYVSNESVLYFLKLEGTTFLGSGFFKFRGAEIGYTITRPLP